MREKVLWRADTIEPQNVEQGMSNDEVHQSLPLFYFLLRHSFNLVPKFRLGSHILDALLRNVPRIVAILVVIRRGASGIGVPKL